MLGRTSALRAAAAACMHCLRPALCLCAAAGAALSVAASATTAVARTSASAASAKCGTVPTIAPKGSRYGLNVIKALPAAYQAEYNAFDYPVVGSAYAHWKPKHKGPITIGTSTIETSNGTSDQLNTGLSLSVLQKEIPHVKKVVSLTYPLSSTGLTTEIQQVNQLIQEKVSVIMIEADSGQAFVPIAKRAFEAGIPFISLENEIPSPYAINLSYNGVVNALQTGAWLAKTIGGKGTVLGVQGIPGVPTNSDSFAGWTKAFALCPGITFDDSPVGDYSVAVAKQAVLSYLTTHPTPVAGVVQAGAMAGGVIQAFQQDGRSVPPTVLLAGTLGDFAYWAQNKSKFKSIGEEVPDTDLARAAAYTAAEMFSGHDPKINMLLSNAAQITTANLSKWVRPGTSVDNATAGTGPKGAWLSERYLKAFFS
jgi:ribose transport system substrate-binding protein